MIEIRRLSLSCRALPSVLATLFFLSLSGCFGLTTFPADEPEGSEHDDDDSGEPVEGDDDDTDDPVEGDDDDDDDTDDPPVAEDDATILSVELPSVMECGEVVLASVLVGNTGSATWTRDTHYKLGVVDDEDPFYADSTRVWLDGEDAVSPGHSHLFTFELEAPEEEGIYVSDWQMVHEGVQWFGEIASQDIEVLCDSDPGPPDLGTVTWLHTDVSQWTETATLASVSTNGSQICLDYDMANVWPIYNIGVDVVANPWIFIWENEQWYGATWEWLRPGQTCKAITSVAGSHIKQHPFGENSGWVPTSGTTYWFMVSGLARFSERNVEERSNLVPFVWP